jgi:hypothetical protein
VERGMAQIQHFHLPSRRGCFQRLL